MTTSRLRCRQLTEGQAQSPAWWKVHAFANPVLLFAPPSPPSLGSHLSLFYMGRLSWVWIFPKQACIRRTTAWLSLSTCQTRSPSGAAQQAQTAGRLQTPGWRRTFQTTMLTLPQVRTSFTSLLQLSASLTLCYQPSESKACLLTFPQLSRPLSIHPFIYLSVCVCVCLHIYLLVARPCAAHPQYVLPSTSICPSLAMPRAIPPPDTCRVSPIPPPPPPFPLCLQSLFLRLVGSFQTLLYLLPYVLHPACPSQVAPRLQQDFLGHAPHPLPSLPLPLS